MKKKIFYLFILIGVSFLFTTNTKAFTVYSDTNYTIDEEFIFNTFKSEYSDFSLNEFPYISCTYRHYNSQYVSCTASTQKLFDNLILYQNSNGIGRWKNYEITTSSITFIYKIYNNTFSINSTINEVFPYYDSSVSILTLYYNNSYENSYTNYNISILPGMSSNYDLKLNKLDFSEFEVQLKYDENLFANDENFKKVCVDKNFSITKTPVDGVLSETDHDFIWFPYGMSGIKQFNFSTELSNKYHEFDNPYEHFYFSDFDNIDRIWNMEYMAGNFESKGYIDRYKYYGYTAYMFLHWYNFNDDNSYNYFPIFILENPTISHISSSGNQHGGGGSRLESDEDIEFNNEYCFYIKKEYEVNEVNINEWGDYFTSVDTPTGTIDYNTNVNKDKSNFSSLLSQPIKFITEMSGTIGFINTQILNCYLSMPLIVRMFIITSLTILLIILIMKIGGYK